MDTLSKSISIFIRKNSPPGIIFSGRNHPHTKESVGRDYFLRTKSSPYKGICRQRWFFRIEIILTQRNSSPGIIFPSRIHPHSKEFASRDYFPKPKASPYKGICRQGLFSRAEIIPTQKNLFPGIIFPSQIHPHSKEFASRDALGI